MSASRLLYPIVRFPAAIGAVVIAGVVGVAVGSALLGGSAALLSNTVEALRQSGAWGSLFFLAGAIVITLSGVIPASLLGLAAGPIFGLWLGFALSACGLLVGAALAFTLSRSALRPAIERMLARRGYLRGLDAAVASRGWSFVVLLRLSPVVPFSAASYLLGMSSIGFRSYLAGTLGALPGLFGYVFCGTLAGAGLSLATVSGSPIRSVSLGVGALATLAALALLGRLLVRPAVWDASIDNGSA